MFCYYLVYFYSVLDFLPKLNCLQGIQYVQHVLQEIPLSLEVQVVWIIVWGIWVRWKEVLCWQMHDVIFYCHVPKLEKESKLYCYAVNWHYCNMPFSVNSFISWLAN